MIKILAIGDTANAITTLKKFVKKSTMDVIQFSSKNRDVISYEKDTKFFKSKTVLGQVDELLKLKSTYDLFIVTGWSGARLAYLANLKYLWIFLGSDIRDPFFVKSKTNNFNILERFFYKKVFDDASGYIVLIEMDYPNLNKYTNKGIIIGAAVDTKKFNPDVKPIDLHKKKFTFFCPTRIGYEKGTNIIWEAISKCKSDFEVLQVEWYDEQTSEMKEKNRQLLKMKPDNVKLIPIVGNEEIARYYTFADAVIGTGIGGWPSGIEREAAFCRRPVVTYTDLKYKVKIDDSLQSPPFLPTSSNPSEFSEIMDKIVLSPEFRNKNAKQGYEFVKKTSEPNIIIQKYEKVFQKLDNEKVKKRSLFLRKFFFLFSYYSNLKRSVGKI